MPIILPTFEIREKLTAEKLNTFRDAIESKFAGGITPAEFTWPFVVQGNIDFGGIYGIVGLKTFWNLINAAEYTSLQLAVDAATAAGGGTVVIPPDTTIETNGVNLTSSLVTIMGFGPSSVLKLSSGSSSGYFFRTAAGGLTDIEIMHLAMDGQNTGTAQAGVIARRVNRFTMDHVDIKNFTGPFVQVTHDGAAGNSCSNVSLTHLRFNGGSSSSANHLKIEDCDGLMLDDIVSSTCPTDAILMEPTGAAGILRDIGGSRVRVNSPTGRGIAILGASATSDTKWSHVGLDNCQVRGSTGNAFEIGTTSKLLQDVTLNACRAPVSGAKALRIAAERGIVSANHFHDAVTIAIDMENSIDLVVHGNNCRDSVTGINAVNTTTCEVYGNNVQDCTNPILGTTSTGLRLGINYGAHNGVPGSVFKDSALYSRVADGTFGFTYTIPGGTLKIGDVLTIRVYCNKTGGTGPADLTALIGATALGTTGNTPSAATDFIAQWDVIVNAVSGDTDCIVQALGASFVQAARSAGLAINWAIDNALTFTTDLTAGDTVDLRPVIVTLNGAK